MMKRAEDRKRERTGAAFLGLLVLSSWSMFCTTYDEEQVPVELGMVESEVERLLGNPSYVIDDDSLIPDVLEAKCGGRKPVRLLVYSSWFSPDTAIGMDEHSRVACIDVAEYMKYPKLP